MRELQEDPMTMTVMGRIDDDVRHCLLTDLSCNVWKFRFEERSEGCQEFISFIVSIFGRTLSMNLKIESGSLNIFSLLEPLSYTYSWNKLEKSKEE